MTYRRKTASCRQLGNVLAALVVLFTGASLARAAAPSFLGPLPAPVGRGFVLSPDPSAKPEPAALDQEDVARRQEATTRAGEKLRQSLLDVAEDYGRRTYVPYVWGGSAISSEPAVCQECRVCLGKHRGGHRSGACPACASCGVDCSHFVHRMLNEAGLAYPYLSTAHLKHMSKVSLRRNGLVDIGRDLSKARPGDLLLHDRHIVMLLELRGAKVGDFIHVNRAVKHGKVGGIQIVRNSPIERFRGRVLRILRHVALEAPTAPQKPQAPNLLPPAPHPYDFGYLQIVRAD